MKAQNILLVDDDEDDQVLFIDALNQINNSLNCYIANNGIEALNTLRQTSPMPDIIFLDLNMPKMGGYECLAEIKKERKFNHIPVIIFSTTKIDSERQRTIQMGANYFFTKPSDFNILTKELTKILQTELK
jgi:CheY-like chemotaxis protein